jgi:pimeloyl-ACP methyl ester carboxylesterase
MISYFYFRHHKICYRKIGSGSKIVLAFHGVQQTFDAFGFLEGYQWLDYTIIALDLPFHGATVWQDNTLANEDLLALMEAFMQQLDCTQIDLLAYSIGAKCAGVLIAQQPTWVRSVAFVAPDGIRENIWYQLATKNKIGKGVFKYIMYRPKWLQKIIALGRFTGLITRQDATYFALIAKDTTATDNLYKIWMGFSDLRVNTHVLMEQMNEYEIPVTLIVGKKDTTIPLSHVQPLIKAIKHIDYIVLNKGHKLLDKSIVPHLQKHFLK